MIAIDQLRVALAKLNGRTPKATSVRLHMCGAITLGLLATLPFVCAFDWPEHPPLPLWVPYGAAQMITYACLYALLGAMGLGIILLLLVASSSKPSKSDDAADDVEPSLALACPSDKADCVPTRSQGGKLRVWVLMVLFTARCFGESVMCAILAANAGSDDPIRGSDAELLFMLVLFEDGQGFLTAMLIGAPAGLGLALRGLWSHLRSTVVAKWCCCIDDDGQSDRPPFMNQDSNVGTRSEVLPSF